MLGALWRCPFQASSPSRAFQSWDWSTPEPRLPALASPSGGAQWGALKTFTSTVHGAHGKPLHIAGRTEHLDIQWGEARGRASFIVIVGLESPTCLIGMDIMRPLRVRIDVTEGTTTPAQPDPQTIYLNAA